MAASSCATDSSSSPEISSKKNECFISQPTQGKDLTLVCYLKVNKSKFSWQGTFELLQFVKQHLGFTCELMKVSKNETKKTIKEEQLCK